MYLNQKVALMALLSLFLGFSKGEAGIVQLKQQETKQLHSANVAVTGYASLIFNPPSIIVPLQGYPGFNPGVNTANPSQLYYSNKIPKYIWGTAIYPTDPQPVYLTFNVPQDFVAEAGGTEVIVHFVTQGQSDDNQTMQVELTLTSGFTPVGEALAPSSAQSQTVDVSNSTNIIHYSSTFALTDEINPNDFAQITLARSDPGDTWVDNIYITSIEFRYPTGTP